jgi:hypothetical protein
VSKITGLRMLGEPSVDQLHSSVESQLAEISKLRLKRVPCKAPPAPLGECDDSSKVLDWVVIQQELQIRAWWGGGFE